MDAPIPGLVALGLKAGVEEERLTEGLAGVGEQAIKMMLEARLAPQEGTR